ncbi:MAG: hypothetical protein EXR59_05645 [Dehalococcoidia bacterium]|nr:hypothetical protein [Dehalococcoidia bacterium]
MARNTASGDTSAFKKPASDGGRLPRKAFHLIAGSALPVLALLTPGDFAFWVAASLALGMVIVEVVRLRNRQANQLFMKTISLLMKEREENSITAATHMLIATAICLGAFDKEVGALAILYTAVGDPSAAVTGERFGRIHIAGKKTLEGTLAFAVAAGAIAIGVGLAATDVWIVAALAGVIAAAIAEFDSGRLRVPIIGLLDDNLMVPLTAVIVMTVVTAIGA